jgi:hypothetical protein
MVAKRMRITPGKVAIWTDPSDTDPFVAPLSNLSRVKFHTDLDYLPIVAVHDYTITLPAIPSSGSGQGPANSGRRGLRTNNYTLGPHGMGFTPFCVGEIELDGVPMVLSGTIPVAQISGDRYGRFLSLGFDATNITAYEYSVQRGLHDDPVDWYPRPAVDIDIRVYVSAVSLDDDNDPGPGEAIFHLDEEEMIAGTFAASKRYIREVADPDDAMLVLADSNTYALNVDDDDVNWRWEIGSVTRVGSNNVVSAPSAGFTTTKLIAL